jgi:hypothetical protein
VPDIDDQCPATPPDDFVDLFGCSVFLLPPSNFTIIKTDEICRSSNNGKIKITAEKLYNYTATLVTDSVSKEFNFTNGVEIRDLRAGTYRLCITIKDKPGFSSCYDIVIKEPVDLAVLTKIEMEGEVVSLQLSGGTNYHIELNGKSFNTSATSITLALQQGINTLIIKADKECLGIYKNTIIIPGKLLYFPNPFMDRFTILIKGDNSREVIVNLYDITGKQVMSKLQPIQNGTVNVDASFLSSGIYTASIQSRVAIHTFKIIKK